LLNHEYMNGEMLPFVVFILLCFLLCVCALCVKVAAMGVFFFNAAGVNE